MKYLTEKRKKWIFFLGYALYCCVYMCRFNLTTSSVLLQLNGIVDTRQYGLLGSVFAVTYSVGRVLNGYLGDRLNGRIMISGGIMLAGIANILAGTFPPFGVLMLLWSVNGYAQSMIWGPLLCTVTESFSEKGKGLAGSVLTSSVSVGSVLGILLAKWSMARFALGFVFYIPGFLALALGITAAFGFENKDAKSQEERLSLRESLSKSRKILPMTTAAFFHGFMKDSVSAWAALIFFRCFHIELDGISYFVLMVPTIGVIGRLLYPVLYRRIRNESRIAVSGFCICCISAIVLCVSKTAWITAVCLCVIAAAVSTINTGMLSTYPMRFMEEGLVSSVSGWMDFATYMGSAISSAVFGAMLAGEVPHFNGMYICWLGASLISIWILIKKTEFKREKGRK